MTKSLLFAVLLAATVSITLPASAQNGKAAVKPADPPSKVVVDSWNDIGRKLHRHGRRLP